MMALIIKRRPEAGLRFPFISLPRAIDRGRELYKVAAGHEVPIGTAMKAWTYGEKSSGGLQTAAALKAFGLLEDVGGGEVRKVKLTENALRIIRDPRDISPDRDGLIRDAALAPTLHRDVIEHFGGMPPSDEALKAFLLIDRNMKDDAVPDFIREFTATMAFAKVAESGSIQDMEDALFKAGAENFVDDVLPAPVAGPAGIVRAAGSSRQAAPSPGAGLRQEVFALDEGDIVITFPEDLSAESYSELAAYLDLFKKKMRRRSGAPPETPRGQVASSGAESSPENG